MVQGVGDDGVLLAQQAFEETAVGIEAGTEEDGVLGAEEGAEALLKLLVQGLGAADEAHGGHAVAPAVDGVLGGLHQHRAVGQAQVVVGAHVDDLAAILQAHFGVLLGVDIALLLEQTGGLQGLQVAHQTVLELGIVHEISRGEIESRKILLPLVSKVNAYSGRFVA